MAKNRAETLMRELLTFAGITINGGQPYDIEVHKYALFRRVLKDEAQEHKLELICKKIGLKEGVTVLDLGCGWGSFAKYAAEKYNARVTGLNISKKQ